jgi:hypothetical protein
MGLEYLVDGIVADAEKLHRFISHLTDSMSVPALTGDIGGRMHAEPRV